MIEFKEHDKQRIKPLIERFTAFSIDDLNPQGFCLSTSFPLSIYLESLGITNFIVVGEMNNLEHYWLHLPGYEVIVDATIKQFDDNHDPIYIGKISDNQITRQYKLKNKGFNEWIKSYQIWCTPEVDVCNEPREDKIAKKLVLNNLINASILAYEIENLDSLTKSRTITSFLYKLYFNSILYGLKNKWRTDKIIVNVVKEKVANEFEFLLSKLV